MKLLALDTSSIACSVALQVEGVVTERHVEEPRAHTRLLVPMIRSLIDASDIDLKELDAIILGNGPGSFIGMRIAASVAQGLAHGSDLNIVPVSSLAAVAAEVFAETDAAEVVVAQDAHMSEVYLGAYRQDEGGLPVEVFAERLQKQEAIAEIAEVSAEQRYAAGAGWSRYPELLECNAEHFCGVLEIEHPRARHLLGMGARAVEVGDVTSPKELVPAYLRQKVAEKPAKPS